MRMYTMHWLHRLDGFCAVIQHLLRWWYLRQQRVRVGEMIGFLVRGRVRIKTRFRVRVRVGVTFNVSIYHRSNCRRSKCWTFVWAGKNWHYPRVRCQGGCQGNAGVPCGSDIGLLQCIRNSCTTPSKLVLYKPMEAERAADGTIAQQTYHCTAAVMSQ